MSNETLQGPVGFTCTSTSLGEVGLSNLTNSEVEMIEAMLAGTCRIECVEGRLVRRSIYEKPPGPIEDPLIAPYWQPVIPEPQPRLVEVIYTEIDHAMSSSIFIQHLCGYDWTPEKYRKEAEKLESYGFTCLRSRRESDAKFWEIWYLPFLSLAKGDLGRFIESQSYERTDDLPELYRRAKKQLDAIARFMCQNVSFGSMDFTYQRAAMTVE